MYHLSCVISSFLVSKTSSTGLTVFYGLESNAIRSELRFLFRSEGLGQGFKQVLIPGVSLSGGSFHHLAVVLSSPTLAVYVDGVLQSKRSLSALGRLEDIDHPSHQLHVGDRYRNPGSEFKGQNFLQHTSLQKCFFSSYPTYMPSLQGLQQINVHRARVLVVSGFR